MSRKWRNILIGVVVAALAITEMGRKACRQLVPSSDAAEVRRRQAETEEASTVLAYNGAKAAVIQMTKAMAVELGPYNVRVNALAPGSTLNPQLMEVFYSDKERAEGMLSHFPLGRTADPYEQAAMVAFFASDDASYVTGLTGVVDGGWICGFNKNPM